MKITCNSYFKMVSSYQLVGNHPFTDDILRKEMRFKQLEVGNEGLTSEIKIN